MANVWFSNLWPYFHSRQVNLTVSKFQVTIFIFYLTSCAQGKFHFEGVADEFIISSILLCERITANII